MQQTVYKCDHCKREIGKVPHISLMLNLGVSGVAVPPKSGGPWLIERLPSGFIHFCRIEHLTAFFKAELDKTKKTKNQPKK